LAIKQEIETTFLALGSNSPDALSYISEAISLIEKNIGQGCLKKSSNYSNEAQGFSSSTLFINSVIKLDTRLSPTKLLLECERIERLLGRNSKSINEYADRVIDIDIIFYANHIITEDRLQIPHLRFQQRDFVLYPLLEIDCVLIDPRTQLSVKQLIGLLPRSREIFKL
jgi:2-amino-4-hydroxy-6-hydroxymethyldihydropteridine diphosphokinase